MDLMQNHFLLLALLTYLRSNLTLNREQTTATHEGIINFLLQIKYRTFCLVGSAVTFYVHNRVDVSHCSKGRFMILVLYC